MGNSPSQEELDSVGYRVLGVQPNSPASNCGLVSFFDFIVAANGVPLRTMDTTFIDLIKASEDVMLPLTVYNWKSQSTREVSLTPSRNWAGEGMLGITIRFDTYHNAEDYVCHVLEVEPNSPADLAGLQEGTDYILGTTEKFFRDVDALFDELQEHLNKPLEFYVYSSETDEVRNVVIMPSNEWGGEGILGANVACGFLHRIPKDNRDSTGRAVNGYYATSASSPFGQNSVAVPPTQPDVNNSPKKDPVEPVNETVDLEGGAA
mmetsp:Transcript_1779/g.2795  ORF Transcript_1779/g.2795 Transcript_1779/m.2795 type:complete len:263 (+) Transcript_1779:119-907(+)|eukprot:CAMPEP_0185029762 /NCGR_PEP_ID=MMETSP1103-20130426/16254_1 /TAXON_ID=36769 /ORGANISM="Paraphysomonas bandaiensis, Strain Caron Lab Isolate" /LENGTH=262 /DNA_ID=CAMNT_0027564619 /DNA_START=76 /DNA_END=864 /DNA_ORIENTATION=-